MRFIVIATLSLLFVCPSALAQSKCEKELGIKPVSWTFPKPGIATKVIDGDTYYQLAERIYATKTITAECLTLVFVMLPPEMVEIGELARQHEAPKPYDVDKFLAAAAVLKAVETPEGYDNEYLGKTLINGKLFYIFKTKSGANVGANVNGERSVVVIMPTPEMKK